MRNKRAKLMRKIVKQDVGHLPEVNYTTQSHSKELLTGGLDPTTGLPVKRRVMVSQTLLGACQRSIYKQVKWAFKNGGLNHG